LGKLAEDTATRLYNKGQLPDVSVPQAAGAAAAAQPVVTAATATGAAGEVSAEEAAALRAAAADAAAEVERNKSRMQNVAIFFAAYMAFKYVVDHELL
jgi:hypothetical protein